ncbi:MAG TPA: hypothetical protein VL131_02210 [Gammaproteobacteria bacterium]|nr:hypothetical protein [Gammaproteobacteria bacterium]
MKPSVRVALSFAVLAAAAAATVAVLRVQSRGDGAVSHGPARGGDAPGEQAYDREPSAAPADAAERYDAEYPTMHYASAPRSDAIAKLEARLQSGAIRLESGPRGYLDSLLAALRIDASSQTLVFSQTSLQSRRINPRTPRAIYFNDDVYVAWVQNGPLEIGALDPNLGPVFYLLQQPMAGSAAAPAPKLERDFTRCLSCHDSYSLSGGGVPRFIVGSGYTGIGGNLVSHEGWILVTDETPLKSRWGGWYVTGQSGEQVHLGNVVIRDLKDFDRLDELRVGNLETLDGLFDTKPYLTNKSDIVALMILEHQVNAQNAITRVNFDVRTAIDRERGAAKSRDGYELPADQLSPATRKAIDDAVEPLVQTLLFANETRLTAPVVGDPRFVEQFMSRAIMDSRGRSLRDLDRRSRLFRYPLSYVVYSAAFDALPRVAREAVYRRVAELLRGAGNADAVARLRPDERAAILEILGATKPEFAAVSAAEPRAEER